MVHSTMLPASEANLQPRERRGRFYEPAALAPQLDRDLPRRRRRRRRLDIKLADAAENFRPGNPSSAKARAKRAIERPFSAVEKDFRTIKERD